ncbi:hypothetical protein [Methanoregula sp. UBA64]|uniref:hypothetical protein n=1 Tax=Methanoregula sp. UBA64 TaxID=1915554 RepID=UPI0025EAAD57|nr:hypothetical protein [Methanoregula sp. UBA64]
MELLGEVFRDVEEESFFTDMDFVILAFTSYFEEIPEKERVIAYLFTAKIIPMDIFYLVERVS